MTRLQKLVLAMKAGSHAINNTKRLHGACLRAGSETIDFLEAAKILLVMADSIEVNMTDDEVNALALELPDFDDYSMVVGEETT